MLGAGGEDITSLLEAAHEGDRSALDRLAPRVYGELKRLADGMMRGERREHTLQPTALVNEAWLKLVRQDSVGFRHRAQFFSTAATVMRRILSNHARARRSRKRGDGVRPEPLDEVVAALEHDGPELPELEQALESLARILPRKARLIELRFFLGLGMQETADILEISKREAERDWTFARAWLQQRLEGEIT